MRRVFPHIRVPVFLLTGLFIFNHSLPQTTLNTYIESAYNTDPELTSLQIQMKYYSLQEEMILAQNRKPNGYLSGDLLISPYFNNDGKPISTMPADKAYGYDIGITNGGLYSLLANVEYPVFNKPQTKVLLNQNSIESEKTKTRAKIRRVEISHGITKNYLDVLELQMELQNLDSILNIKNIQNKILNSLTRKGLYRIADLELFEASLQTDSISWLEKRSDFQHAQKQLNILCGIPDNTTETLLLPELELKNEINDTSIFTKPFIEDSLSAIISQLVFENQYRLHFKLFANAGINSTNLSHIDHHWGMSAGAQMTYTLFDGKQKEIYKKQQLLLVDEASQLMNRKTEVIQAQRGTWQSALEQIHQILEKEKALNEKYIDLYTIYNEELKKSQIGINEYLYFLQQYASVRLSEQKHKVTLLRFINEYNYWNN